MRHWAVGATLALATSACGSTVAMSTTTGTVGPGGTTAQDPYGVNAPQASAAPGVVAGTGTTGAGQPIAGATGDGTGGTTGASPSGVPGTVSTSGRGFTGKEIRIGYQYSSDGAGIAGSFGVNTSYLNAGDINQQMRAVAGYLNAHGGILGRKVVPEAVNVSSADALANPQATAQQLCETWALDKKVFVALNPTGLNNQVLRACMAKYDTPILEASGRTWGVPEFRKYASYLYTPGTPTTDLMVQLWVSSLARQGFFKGWDTTTGSPGSAPMKIGVMVVDRPEQRYQHTRLKAELAKHGLKVEDEYFYDPNPDALVSASNSAALKFRADGITHVFGAYVFFHNNAKSQGYYPRYAIDPGGGAAAAAAAPDGAMRGAMSSGWVPASDVAPADYPGDPTPAATLCKKIMKAAGMSVDAADGALANMMGVCDNMFLVAAALNRAGSISTAALRSGIESLGDSWQSAQTWLSRWGPDRHASALAMRDQAWFADCKCFRYTSRVNRTS
jgi:hypothetical protein